jgi:hypothetical protein
MTEPPTHRVATDFDEIKQLREVIDALRANNGRLLRLLTWEINGGPQKATRPTKNPNTAFIFAAPSNFPWPHT